MFPELKHYLRVCDKDANIKHTIIGHLKMLAQKFEDYYGEVLTPSDKDDWILDPFSGKICLIYLSMLQKSLCT